MLVNGQSVTLGPNDDQYAVVTTGTDGALVITSGSTQRDSSGKFVDGADMTALPLRAWAHFMDPYERMVVYRDREFHNRVSTAHATDAGQAGADDPTRANLQTAQAYGAVQKGGGNTGTSLFTDQQKQQSQPQNVANAIQKMTGCGRHGPTQDQQESQGKLEPARGRHAGQVHRLPRHARRAVFAGQRRRRSQRGRAPAAAV